jgi:DNA-binding winged helix-turn-helix (wHTH) protein
MLLPYLEITDPNGSQESVQLQKIRYTLGQFPRVNDICIADELVSRIEHCVIERHSEGWFVKDTKSTNGTVLVREGFQGQTLSLSIQQQEKQQARLEPGDLIILAESDWMVKFQDPNPTPKNNVGNEAIVPLKFVYNLSRHSLSRLRGSDPAQELTLRPKAREMVTYMAQRNWDNHQSPIVCTYEELIQAIWPDKPDKMIPNDLQGLAREIRKEFNASGGEGFRLLETRKGLGFILQISVER